MKPFNLKSVCFQNLKMLLVFVVRVVLTYIGAITRAQQCSEGGES